MCMATTIPYLLRGERHSKRAVNETIGDKIHQLMTKLIVHFEYTLLKYLTIIRSIILYKYTYLLVTYPIHVYRVRSYTEKKI